jgi:hypothetical protein
MKMRWAWMLPVLSVLALLKPAAAQAPTPTMVPGYYPVMPAGYMGGPGGQPGLLPDAYGAYGSAPTGAPGGGPPPMGPDMMGGMGMGGMDGMGMGMGGGCPHCGGMGCDACGGGHGHGLQNGLLGDVFGLCAPYPDGGCAAVRWYDFAVDAMFLRREDAGRGIDLTSQNINGDIVLGTGQLDFDNEAGFRFTGMFQWGPGSSLEFTYFGLVFHQAAAEVSDPTNNLFSTYSSFGSFPFNGFDETDQSDFQSIAYESQFHNIEANFRQRWMAPNCRYQGSCLIGIRYFQLDEDFDYFSQSTLRGDPGPPVVPASQLTSVVTHNALTGVQVGGDLWVCVLPGLRLGGELKAGVFGNHAAIDTTIDINPGSEAFVEELTANDVAFVGDLDLLATYRLNYQWTLRAGYKFLYVDGVALATDNFNSAPPELFFAGGKTRVPGANDDGNVFYHGWTVGAEFMW